MLRSHLWLLARSVARSVSHMEQGTRSSTRGVGHTEYRTRSRALVRCTRSEARGAVHVESDTRSLARGAVHMLRACGVRHAFAAVCVVACMVSGSWQFAGERVLSRLVVMRPCSVRDPRGWVCALYCSQCLTLLLVVISSSRLFAKEMGTDVGVVKPPLLSQFNRSVFWL